MKKKININGEVFKEKIINAAKEKGIKEKLQSISKYLGFGADYLGDVVRSGHISSNGAQIISDMLGVSQEEYAVGTQTKKKIKLAPSVAEEIENAKSTLGVKTYEDLLRKIGDKTHAAQYLHGVKRTGVINQYTYDCFTRHGIHLSTGDEKNSVDPQDYDLREDFPNYEAANKLLSFALILANGAIVTDDENVTEGVKETVLQFTDAIVTLVNLIPKR